MAEVVSRQALLEIVEQKRVKRDRVALAFSSLRHANTTCQCGMSARNLAVAKPIPTFAPVMTTVFTTSPRFSVRAGLRDESQRVQRQKHDFDDGDRPLIPHGQGSAVIHEAEDSDDKGHAHEDG